MRGFAKKNSEWTKFNLPSGPTELKAADLKPLDESFLLLIGGEWQARSLLDITRAFVDSMYRAKRPKARTTFLCRALHYLLFGLPSDVFLDPTIDLAEMYRQSMDVMMQAGECAALPLVVAPPEAKKARVSGGTVCTFRANKWQRDLATRVANHCRNNFGMLIDHGVGTGKTLSLWLVLANLPHAQKKILIVPRAIMVDFGENGDIALLYPDITARRAFLKNVHLIALDKRRNDSELSLMDYLNLDNQETTRKFFKDAIVSIDEVHVFVALLRAERSQQVWQNFIRARDVATRLFVMSGTPIVANMSDLTIIMSMVNRAKIYPMTDTEFEQMYYSQTAEDLAREKKQGIVSLVSTGTLKIVEMFISMPLMVSLGSTFGLLGMYGEAAYGYGISAALTTVDATKHYLAAAVLATVVTYAILTKYHEYAGQFFTNMQQVISAAVYSSPNVEAIKADMLQYVSMFHYALETPTLDMPAKFKFPRAQLTEVQVPYTSQQIMLMLRITDRDSLFSIPDARAMALGISDDIRDPNTYLDYVSRIGDVSPDSYYYDTEFAANPQKLHLEQYHGVRNQFEADDEYYGPEDHGTFACPKYTSALAIIMRYAMLSRPHLASHAGIQTTLLTSMKTKYLDELDVPQTYEVEVVQSNGKNKQILKGNKHGPTENEKECYLPIVYCAHERTLREFSAYLNSLKYDHYIFLPGDTDERRQKLKEAVVFKRYPVGSLNRPVCALLHPSILLGLSLTYNPCLIVLDLIRGYGNNEQVHGRVLRTLDLEDTLADFYNTSREDDDRLLKVIYQMRSGYVAKNVALKWAPPDMDTLRKIALTKYKTVGVSAYLSARRDALYNRFRKFYWAGWAGNFGTNLHSAYSKEYDNARYRSNNPTPEILVDDENERQKRVIDTVTELFSVATDDVLAAQCGSSICQVCFSGQCCAETPDACARAKLK